MRIVVKLGSSLVATSKGAVRRSLLAARATEVAALVAGGHSVCIVSSGAIALGAPRLGFERRPSTMRQLQAASAVGQAQLHQAWERALAEAIVRHFKEGARVAVSTRS
jgi:glutamate 5-kinase